jgi:lipopolysaccharide exporter
VTTVRRSLFFALAERYLLLLLQLASFIVLARLLTPEDIGLYSVASAVIGLAQVVRDFGVGSYLIQEKELTPERVRTAFTITLLIAVVLFAVTQLAAYQVALFYRDPRLERVLLLLSINFLIIPLNSTNMALMRRDMQFGKLMSMNVVATLAGTGTSITLAALGQGYISLVWAALVNTATVAITGSIVRRGGFWHWPTLREWRRVFYFGSRATLASIITEIAMNINDLVIGRVLGFSAVGILSRAQGVMNLFHRDVMGAVRSVALPAFAKAHREGADLEILHTRSITAVTAFSWPFYGFLGLFPLESLRLLFGHQWDAAAHLVPVFCLAGAVASCWNLILPMLTASGRINLTVRAEILIQLIRIGTLVSCVLFFDTLLPYAISFLFIYILCLPVFYYYKNFASPTRWLPVLRGLGASLLLMLFALAPPGLIKVLMVIGYLNWNEYLVVPMAALSTALGWLLGLRVLKHPVIHDPLVPDRFRRLFCF